MLCVPFWSSTLHTGSSSIAADQIVEGIVRSQRCSAVITHVKGAFDGRVLTEQDGDGIKKHDLKARAHGIDVRKQIFFRLDLLGFCLGQELLLPERSLRDADAVGNVFRPTIAHEGDLFGVAFGIDADAAQRRLELLDVVRDDLVFQGAGHGRIAQFAVVHRDDLLYGLRDHGACIAAQGCGCCRKAERNAQQKDDSKLLHKLLATRLF